jgi:pyruvate kinase
MEHLNTYLRERGRLSELAKALGVTPSAIAQWKRVPAERASEVSRITGIRLADLRPDIFEAAQ